MRTTTHSETLRALTRITLANETKLAAARAMLAALKAAESRIETPDDLNDDEKRHVQEDIRAAIAQAEAAGIKGE